MTSRLLSIENLYPRLGRYDMRLLTNKFDHSRNGASAGFTLIEALIVVALLGILGAIAIPVYQNYISGSKQRAAEAAFEQIPLMLENFRAENGQFPPNGPYLYTEDADGAVTQNDFNGNATDPFQEFKPRSPSASATNFHYTVTISNTGSATEQAVITVTGVDNIAGNYSGITITRTYQ